MFPKQQITKVCFAHSRDVD